MSNQDFEVAFRTAVDETGEAYADARRTVVALQQEAVPELSKKSADKDWRVALTADALAGWIEREELFVECHRYVRGELPGRPPITGRFSAAQRAEKIGELGTDVTPALLEMIVKTGEPSGDTEVAAIFASLARLKDPRAVPPLLEIVGRESPGELRGGALGTLNALEDPRAVAPTAAILGDPTEPASLRSVAARCLGRANAAGAREALEQALLDPASGTELRVAAVEGLRTLGDTRSAPALVQALDPLGDLTLLQSIIELLGELGDRAAAETLADYEQHADDFVRDAATEARARIVGR